MKSISRRMLIGALSLIFLNSACGPGPTPVPMETIFPGGQIQTATPTSITPLIPVTGQNVVSLQCQFCVDTVAHAILILPNFAFFDVSASEPVTCLTAQVVNGQRVLLCRGAELTTFTLDICSDPSNCLQFPVTLEACPLTPVVQAPIDTPIPIPPTSAANTPTPLSTQTVLAPQAVLPTRVVIAPHLQPTRATAPVSTPVIQQPGTGPGLQDPAEFARWYFGAVWQERNYQNLWDNYLTQSFKTNVGSGSFEDYVTWWGSVERIDAHSVDVIQNDGTHAWVRVKVTFTMKDGRIIDNQEYDYNLLYDANRRTWMFDYRT